MKHLNTKASTLILAALLALCLLFTGCVSVSDVTNAVKEAVSEATTQNNAAEATDAPATGTDAPVSKKQISDEKMMEAFERVMKKALQSAEDRDYAGFCAVHCEEMSEDFLQNEYSIYQSVLAPHDKHLYYLIWRDETRALFGCSFYTVTGTHPNTNRSSNFFMRFLSMEDGENRLYWPAEEEMAAIEGAITESNDKIYCDVLGGEAASFRAAKAAGRNCAYFGEPWLMTRSDICYEGCNESPRVMLAWQEENGDVKLLLWTANGTSQNITDYEIQMRMDDQQLGTVYDITLGDSIVVKSRHNVCSVITVPADQIRTGTAVWGSLSSNVHNSNR